MSANKAPLCGHDMPPGTVVKTNWTESIWHAVVEVFPSGFRTSGSIFYFEHCMENVSMNRSIPLTGKWDDAAWEPCHHTL